MKNNLRNRDRFWKKYGIIVRKYNLLPISCVKFPGKSTRPDLWEAQYEYLKTVVCPLIKKAVEFDLDQVEQTYMILSGDRNPPALKAIRKEIKEAWKQRNSLEPKVSPVEEPVDEVKDVLKKMGIVV